VIEGFVVMMVEAGMLRESGSPICSDSRRIPTFRACVHRTLRFPWPLSSIVRVHESEWPFESRDSKFVAPSVGGSVIQATLFPAQIAMAGMY
jgi:hypothetical protein